MKSLSSRLLTTTAIALSCISGIVVLVLAVLLRWGPDMLINLDLDHNAARIVSGVHFNAAGVPDGVRLNQKMTAIYSVLLQDAAYRVVDQSGVALLSSDHAVTAYAPAGENFDPQRSRFRVLSNGEGQQVLTVPFVHDGRTFYVQLMRSERMQRIMVGSDSEKAQKIAIAVAVVAMLLFSLIVVATLHRALKPLRKASAAAGRIQVDNLSARLSLEDVPSELTPLFNAFNLALQRLEDGYRVQREFIATAAHELKTPLALMRGQIELDERGDRGALLRDLDHMARQVHQLLHLAEASERQNYVMEQIDLKDIAAEASAQLERLAQQREVHIVGVADDEPVMIAARLRRRFRHLQFHRRLGPPRPDQPAGARRRQGDPAVGRVLQRRRRTGALWPRGAGDYLEGYEGRLMRSLKSLLGTSLMDGQTEVGGRALAVPRNCCPTSSANCAAAPSSRPDASSPAPCWAVRCFRRRRPAGRPPGRGHPGRDRARGRLQGDRLPVRADRRRLRLRIHGSTSEELVLIADIGGGTSDFSLVRLSPERADAAERRDDILATGGVHIGGTDFDKYLSLASVMPLLGWQHAGVGLRRCRPAIISTWRPGTPSTRPTQARAWSSKTWRATRPSRPSWRACAS
jgi:two-component system sensor histidine kinase QseC